MALTIRGVCRLNLGIVNNVFSRNNLLSVAVRNLYTENALGVTAYEGTRNLYRNQFQTIETTFRSKMKDVCDSGDAVIFTEDLKAMLHLIQKNEGDLQLINTMIHKYIKSNKDLKFGSYVFGPVVMRMYFYLNEPQVALNTFNTLSDTHFFKQKSTLHILITLLYKNEMYKEMNEVFKFAVENDEWCELTKHCLIVICAGCYRENTAEAFEFALNAWRKLHQKQLTPSSRSSALLTALAIKQNAPELALELIVTVNRQQYINIRCLKVLAYMHLKKYLQIIPILKYALEQDTLTSRQTFYSDVITELESNIREEKAEGVEEIMQLITLLYKHDRITSNMTLEESLLKPRHLMVAKPKELFERGDQPPQRTTEQFGYRSRFNARF
ncbi:pentatricopeptide repeat-containing protein 2, mitochondrial [Augochlora pura]